jgi:hypothetical protein
MAWSDVETLLWIGNFDLEFIWKIDQVKFKYAGGVSDPAITVGHPDGDWGLKLNFSTLPAAAAQFIDPGEEFGGPQSRADYIWRFYQRHKLAGDKPFSVEIAAPGNNNELQEFLMRFTEDGLNYRLIACAMYTSGLQLEQARPRGAQGGGGEVPLENPFTI